MKSLDGMLIHVMTWPEYSDETGIPIFDSKLPPPIVAAVKLQDYNHFRSSRLEQQTRYLHENKSLGRWIPSGLDLKNLPCYIDEIASRILKPLNPQEFIDSASEAMNAVLPNHMPPNTGKYGEMAYALGLSNMVLVSGAARKGVCHEKATLLKAMFGSRYDAQIVGFHEFDRELWSEICETYPPYQIKGDEPMLPAIFMGEAIRQGLVDSFNGKAGVVAFPGKKLVLHPDYPAINNHYWVQVTIDGKIIDLDTSPREAKQDPSYQFMQPYFNKMKSRCPTIQIVGGEQLIK